MAKQAKEIELSEHVSEHYRKFFDKFNEIETLPIKEWKHVHLVGYLAKKYRAHYGINYTFQFNNPAPSKSYEVYIIKKLANMLTSDPVILKEYLDWVFDKKIIEKKKRLTSLAYFSNADLVNDYKFNIYLKKISPSAITRNDALPEKVISACAQKGFEISTYAELAFLKKMDGQETFFEELANLDFDINILNKIA